MSVYLTRLSTMRYLSLIFLWRNDQMSEYSLSFLNIWAYLYQPNLCNWISLSRLRFVLHCDNWYRCLNVMQFLIDKECFTEYYELVIGKVILRYKLYSICLKEILLYVNITFNIDHVDSFQIQYWEICMFVHWCKFIDFLVKEWRTPKHLWLHSTHLWHPQQNQQLAWSISYNP